MKNTDKSAEDSTENRILKAAEKEFLAKGFGGARTTVIAEEAGVTHAMLHYYFRTKEKLFERILSEKFMLLKELIFSPINEREISLFEKIRMIISHHLDFIAANPELPGFIIREFASNPLSMNQAIEAIRTNAREMLSNIQVQIDEESAKGNCRKLDAEMLMLDIVSLNIFSFMASPVVNLIMPGIMKDHDQFIERRKEENYDTIIRKLKP